ncbi:MAG: cell division protein FtsA [Dehalococcoidales bacterium]
MKKSNLVTSIDVGTTKICTIMADVVDDVPRVVGVGISPSRGLHKGLVINIHEARDSIRDSIKKAEQSSNVKIDTAYVGVTGRHVTSNNNHGVVAITRGDRVVRPGDLRRVLTSAQSVKTPADRRLLHVIPRSYAVDGQPGVQNPVGLHGFRLDVETHVITAAVTSIQNLIKCIRTLGVEIEDLVLEPLASSEAVLTDDERQIGVVMADIGGGTTDVAIFRDGSIWHTSILPVAGYQLTRDVSIGLGLPFEIAEEMKKKYGSVMPVYEKNKKGDTSPAISQDGHGVSYQDLCDIIRARVQEILKLIVLEMPDSNYEEIVPGGMVLTGGTSNLSGLAALGRDSLNMPVRIGIPGTMYGIGDMLQDPAYATSVGLLLWGFKNQGRKNWRGNGNAIQKLALQLKKLFG